MIQLTENAIGKVSEILGMQEPKPAGLRIAVVGGGCSGFSYSMAFENTAQYAGQDVRFRRPEGLRRSASMLYLDGAKSITSRRWKARALSSAIHR